MTTHFEEYHEGAVTMSQFDLIIGACEIPVTKFDTSACALCSEWVPPFDEAVNSREFRRHVARHMQQISLESLPLYIDGLVIQEDIEQEGTFICKKGTVMAEFPPYPHYHGPAFAKLDQVIILDDIFDEDFWYVRVMESGEEGRIPRSCIKFIQPLVMPLGRCSACY